MKGKGLLMSSDLSEYSAFSGCLQPSPPSSCINNLFSSFFSNLLHLFEAGGSDR